MAAMQKRNKFIKLGRKYQKLWVGDGAGDGSFYVRFMALHAQVASDMRHLVAVKGTNTKSRMQLLVMSHRLAASLHS